jgi:excisionase family DNA binding protein
VDEQPVLLRLDTSALEAKLDEFMGEVRQTLAFFRGTAPGGYTVQQFAELLQVNPKSVYDGIHAGRVHAVRVGRHYRIPRVWAESYLGAGLGVGHTPLPSDMPTADRPRPRDMRLAPSTAGRAPTSRRGPPNPPAVTHAADDYRDQF